MTQPVFDAHLHIIDPAHPLVEKNGYLPDPFTVADYQEGINGLGIAGGAGVSGSFQPSIRATSSTPAASMASKTASPRSRR